MDNLNFTLIIDLVILLILVWKVLQGRQQGVVKRLGKLAALVCGILGGRIVRDSFADRVSTVLLPRVTELLEKARESLGLSDLLDNLNDILAQVKLPDFLKTNVSESLTTRAGEVLDSAVSSASAIIAQRLSEWLLFLLAAAIIYIVVKLIFDGILDPVIRKLPLVKNVNRLLGAVLGLISGILLAGLLLWLAYHLLPDLSAPGGPLSAAAVAKSWVIKLYFQLFPALFA